MTHYRNDRLPRLIVPHRFLHLLHVRFLLHLLSKRRVGHQWMYLAARLRYHRRPHQTAMLKWMTMTMIMIRSGTPDPLLLHLRSPRLQFQEQPRRRLKASHHRKTDRHHLCHRRYLRFRRASPSSRRMRMIFTLRHSHGSLMIGHHLPLHKRRHISTHRRRHRRRINKHLHLHPHLISKHLPFHLKKELLHFPSQQAKHRHESQWAVSRLMQIELWEVVRLWISNVLLLIRTLLQAILISVLRHTGGHNRDYSLRHYRVARMYLLT